MSKSLHSEIALTIGNTGSRMNLETSLFVGAVTAFTLTAAISDGRTNRLPNWLTVPAFVAALVFHGVTAGLGGLLTAIAGFGTGFGILLVLWLIGGGGGGDVKLMGALGAWLGPTATFLIVLASAALVLVMIVGRFVWQVGTRGYRAKERLLNQTNRRKKGETEAQWLARKQKQRLLPFAIPVALSTWVFLTLKVLAILNDTSTVAAG